ncbi:hypothetical protein LS482_14700 [Sinomicrobium kalidii]|uniref:hypothetical protein n=1 Tax=Sinomicrobium kalidii TaxID=2900738 RepID=UPI001E625267|nr:hypothetical protein [Sinomicrobium kalidii]UGU14938.1 hypothetical protein LS482_14700 [Sinomicrobium kalidii]
MMRTARTTVEIFKTDVTDATTADSCILVLSHHFPNTHINFDLEDCDRILRVEGYHINIRKIIDLLAAMEVCCSLYTD